MKLTTAQFPGNKSPHLKGPEVFKNNWLAPLCIMEHWLFAWCSNKKLRAQKMLERPIQAQFLRPWHFSACEKLNWQEIKVWRVNKSDCPSKLFGFDKSFFKKMFLQEMYEYPWEKGREGERKDLLFILSAFNWTGQGDALMVQAGTESWGTGLRKLLKRAVNVASVLYSTDVICLLHFGCLFLG